MLFLTTSTLIIGRSQQDLYEAFFGNILKSESIIGGLVWNWNQVSQGNGDTSFSIQGKPILNLLKDVFQHRSEHKINLQIFISFFFSEKCESNSNFIADL